MKKPIQINRNKLSPNFRNNNTCLKGPHKLQHHKWLMPMIYIQQFKHKYTLMETHEPQIVYNIQVVNALSKSHAFNQT